MKINYRALLKKAYTVTLQNPLLWLFGLFLSGGFNGNLFYFANIPLGWRDRGHFIFENWINLSPLHHIYQSVSLGLIVIIIVAVIANWMKIIFILRVSDILQLQRRLSVQQQQHKNDVTQNVWNNIKESAQFLPHVTAASLLTFMCVTVVAIVIAVVARWSGGQVATSWVPFVAVVVAAVFVVLFSMLNAFTAFFIVLYRYSLRDGVFLALRLIKTCWVPILETVVLLMAIYGLCYFVGTALVTGIQIVGRADHFLWVQSGILIWMWLAVVNAFFNIVLLILFSLLVKPPLYPEFLEQLELQPTPDLAGEA